MHDCWAKGYATKSVSRALVEALERGVEGLSDYMLQKAWKQSPKCPELKDLIATTLRERTEISSSDGEACRQSGRASS